MHTLLIFIAALWLMASPAGAQALEDCPNYVPSTLEGWIVSPDQRLAVYGYTCRMINIDVTLDRATREGMQPDDTARWAETYRRTLTRIREASALAEP